MAVRDAIRHYHDLLDPELAQESWHLLTDQLSRRGLFFGDRPLASVLRPRFLAADQYAFLRTACGTLLSAFHRLYHRALEDPEFRRQFRMLDWEEELIGDHPGFEDPSPVSRLDAFFVPERGGLRFTEYNAETPAAAAYNDVLAEVFLGLPIMRRFLRDHEVRPIPSRHNVLHALLDAYEKWSGSRQRPTIAILDWREVPTYSEFVISAEYFRAQGIETVIVDPREVEYRDGRLWGDGVAIDLIYKRVLISELVERGGLDHPVIRAVRNHDVCMVNPFRCKILHKKASLAALSDERNRELFTEDQLEAIRRHIPWTRVVEERHTEHDGDTVDLLPFLAQRRDRFVLKPNDEYGGKGIVLGWEVEQPEWEEALRGALEEPMVAQERVPLPTEPYPLVADGELRIEERILDTAPFAFYGSMMDGVLTRLSTETLVNVTAGGGSSLATFIVARR